MKMAICTVIDQVICHVRGFTMLRVANIKRHVSRVPNPQLVIAGIAVFLIGTFAIGIVMVREPGSDDVLGVAPGVQSAFTDFTGRSDDAGRVRSRCPECGVVESTRLIQKPGEEIDADLSGPMARIGNRGAQEHSITATEVTIRMIDGARQHFLDGKHTNWRRGERVIFIAGANRPNE
ncbi:hypothetical protein [Accumulibacter sp.]|uniref:hypothetical protein n=1 Tax=Accumulibacter sp. TaxID=2053492 RepID=UPI0025CC0951|nr:hypothetical protein [Accumulibacter sp.]MCP5228550.1 hypothetical protein [Accumulibacter sp.]